jgi:hypothetical protein
MELLVPGFPFRLLGSWHCTASGLDLGCWCCSMNCASRRCCQYAGRSYREFVYPPTFDRDTVTAEVEPTSAGFASCVCPYPQWWTGIEFCTPALIAGWNESEPGDSGPCTVALGWAQLIQIQVCFHSFALGSPCPGTCSQQLLLRFLKKKNYFYFISKNSQPLLLENNSSSSRKYSLGYI